MDSGSGTKNENHLKAGVSDKLTDTQTLKKNGIKTSFVRVDCLKSDECGAAVNKSSSQKITVSNRPFDLDREFQGSHVSGKQNEQEVRISPACNTKSLPHYGICPDIILVKEIPLITINSDSEEEEHSKRFHASDSNFEIKKESDTADHESTSQLHLNNKSNQSSKALKRKQSDGENLSKRPRRNKQSTAVQASTKIKSSQSHLNYKSNQTDFKVLKRKQSDDILEKQKKRRKRNGQNRAVEAVNNEDPEIKKVIGIDHILGKKYGMKKCHAVIPQPPPEILKLMQPQSFKVHYGQQFLKEIALQAYSSTGSNVVDLDSVYKKARLSKFSSLSRKEFDHQIMVFVKRMYARDLFIKKRLEIIAKLQAKLDELGTKKRFWYKKLNLFLLKMGMQPVS